MDKQTHSPHENPAEDAANLLLRVGFALLVVLAPVISLFSRRAFVIVVPVGALLIILSAILLEGDKLQARVSSALRSPVGIALCCLLCWACASLLWTPFPGAASEKLFRNAGVGMVALLVVCSLPARMRASNLHLMVIGVVASAVLLTIAAVVAPTSWRLADPEAPTLTRGATAAGLMIWPAVAWSQIRGRDRQAIFLAIASAIAIAVSGSLMATVVMLLALATFLIGRIHPYRTSMGLSVIFGALVLLAPLWAYVLKGLAKLMSLAAESSIAEAGRWADVVGNDPLRLLTGHGVDTALRARVAGVVDAGLPGGLVPDIWFEFGLPGALALAICLALAFRGLSRLLQPVAASTLAAMLAAAVYASLDSSSMQIWWLNVLLVLAVMLTAVHHGQYRTARPSADIRRDDPSTRPKL